MKEVRLFLSWAHVDRRLKARLLDDLIPALKVFSDVRFTWWEDSHLTPGEELLPGILDRLNECDFGLLLLSNGYFGRDFIREHELPRFAGPERDKLALPVRLAPYTDRRLRPDLGGIEDLTDFTYEERSFQESGTKRNLFAIECAAAIRRRVLDLQPFRPL